VWISERFGVSTVGYAGQISLARPLGQALVFFGAAGGGGCEVED
jgi:hypothetical protein